MAQVALIYKTERIAARPPQIIRFPRNKPLSRFKGATPTSAAISLRFRVPSSGRLDKSVMESTGPTPGALRKISSFSRQTGLFLRRFCKSLSILFRHFSNQAILVWMSLRVHRGAEVNRFFSTVIMPTIWRRRVINAANFWASWSLRGRNSGRTASPNLAIRWASITSVLASLPVALAKSRICRGLMTTTGKPLSANIATAAVSNPPVASRTTRFGKNCFTKSTTHDMPSSLLEKLINSPVGLTATSNFFLETSIPMNTSFPRSDIDSPCSLPCKRFGILFGPWQLSGLIRRRLRRPSLPHELLVSRENRPAATLNSKRTLCYLLQVGYMNHKSVPNIQGN